MKKVSDRELQDFCFDFQMITGAGVPVVSTLELIGEGTQNRWLKAAILDMMEEIKQGKRLGESMLRHPDIFPENFGPTITGHEHSGSIETAFFRLRNECTQKNQDAQVKKQCASFFAMTLATMMAVATGLCLLQMVWDLASLKSEKSRKSGKRRK